MAEKPKVKSRLHSFFWACIIALIVAGVMALTVLLLYLLGVTRPETAMVLVYAAMTVSAAGAIVSMVMSRVIFAPVARLSDASRQIAKGNFDLTLEYSGSINEIRTTYESFNTMARELGTIETLREDFIANVSHEFKTPLTAIEGYAMLLQDESLPAAERAEYAGRILSNSNRLSSLVSNILLLSKLEQDDVSMPVAAFRLDEQIRQALLSLEPLWTEKELALDVELEEVRYTGCERLLYHVWSNLLSNAVKFSPPGGTLTLMLRPEGNGALFSVTDQGPGMNESEMRHMFDKFYQGDSSRKQEGSGLGLALVRRVLQLCGGRIAVQSAPGVGSTVTVTLPPEPPQGS